MTDNQKIGPKKNSKATSRKTQAANLDFSGSEKTARPLHIVPCEDYPAWLAGIDKVAQSWLASIQFSARPGQLASFPDATGNLAGAVLCLGDQPVWQMAAAAQSCPTGDWTALFHGRAEQQSELLMLGWGLAQYQFDRGQFDRRKIKGGQTTPGGDGDQLPAPGSARLCRSPASERVAPILAGTRLCRDLINMPANKMTPAGLQQAAEQLASRHRAKITTLIGKKLETACPAVHIVGRSAEVPPRLIDLRWGKKGPLVTLVGKGVTFDSGGLDIKPSKAMELMKKDMGGAAHVLGLAEAVMASQLRVRLRVLVPAAENAISERAMRPLDVIDTAAGLPVEVGNTDAEGRLLLADALHIAVQDKPDLLVDFATLTGAARVALGTECPALFANDQSMVQPVMAAADCWDDPVWQLPLFEPYDRFLDSGQAGLSSTGSSGYGGAITAALFLRRFVGRQVNWLHLDVMGWNLSSRPGRPKGGEAMGLRAILGVITKMANQ